MRCQRVSFFQDKLNIYATRSNSHLPILNRMGILTNPLSMCKNIPAPSRTLLKAKVWQMPSQQLPISLYVAAENTIHHFDLHGSQNIHNQGICMKNMKNATFPKITSMKLKYDNVILFILHKAFPILYYAYERICFSLQDINMKDALYFRDM